MVWCVYVQVTLSLPGKGANTAAPGGGHPQHGGEKLGGVQTGVGATPAGEDGPCRGAETDPC